MRGSRGSRGRILALALALTALFAGPISSQTLSEEALREAAAQTGLSQEQLLERLQAQGLEGLQPPGRAELPDREIPEVILPLSLDVEAAPAISGQAASGRQPSSRVFGADFFRLGRKPAVELRTPDDIGIVAGFPAPLIVSELHPGMPTFAQIGDLSL